MISNTFLKYITRTSNVCIYQLGNQKISPTLQFPRARTVTLINCSREGVNRILTPSFQSHFSLLLFNRIFHSCFSIAVKAPLECSFLVESKDLKKNDKAK